MKRTLLVVLAVAALGGCRKSSGPVFLCTGQTLGYLDPCGCTCPQLGGLPRRDRFVGSFKLPPLLLDNGDLTGGTGRQAQIKWQTLITAMGMMGYRAVNVGETDLALGVQLIRDEAAAAGVPLISANVAGPDGKLLFEPYVLLDVQHGSFAGRVAVVGVLAPELATGLDVRVFDPATALDGIAHELRGRCDRTVLLAHAPADQARKLAAHLPGRLFTVCAHETTVAEATASDAGPILSPGQKGLSVVRGRLTVRGGEVAVRAAVVDLGPKFKDSPRIADVLNLYQEVLKLEGLIDRVPRTDHPQGRFAGSSTCQICHVGAMAAWKKSAHSRAYTTLVRHNRNFDPECVVCHSVALTSTGGFRSIEATPDLAHVGCEECHGPGLAHNKAPAAAKMPKIGEQVCLKCHEPDHDAGFDFTSDWRRIRHD